MEASQPLRYFLSFITLAFINTFDNIYFLQKIVRLDSRDNKSRGRSGRSEKNSQCLEREGVRRGKDIRFITFNVILTMTQKIYQNGNMVENVK